MTKPQVYEADALFIEGVRSGATRHPNGSVAAVLDVVLWGRARLSRLPDDRREQIAAFVARSVEAQRPIRIINNFGGFKSVRTSSSPHIDWAEVFHLAFVRRWLLPLCEVYEPGVQLEYTGQGTLGHFVDNIPLDHATIYEHDFAALVGVAQASLPENFSVRVKPFDDFYDTPTLAALFARFASVPIPDEQGKHIDGLLDRASHNFMWDGDRDLTGLAPREAQSTLRQSVWSLLQWYAYDAEARADYFSSGIAISNGVGFGRAYGVRSIAGTDKAFWMAEGVLNATVSPWRRELRVPGDPGLADGVSIEATGWATTVAPGLDSVTIVNATEE